MWFARTSAFSHEMGICCAERPADPALSPHDRYSHFIGQAHEGCSHFKPLARETSSE